MDIDGNVLSLYKESKLQTFKWKTGNILHSKTSPKH